MTDFSRVFEQALRLFPEDAQKRLRTIAENGGTLESEHLGPLLSLLNVNLQQLMIQILPLAACYAMPQISNFRVGAVVCGLSKKIGEANLYLGANMEFAGETLASTIHAEQTAVLNAWHGDEAGLSFIATSAAPCGYCRQFLYELSTAQDLVVLLPDDQKSGTIEAPLSGILPNAFGPGDLGIKNGFMSAGNALPSLSLSQSTNDPLPLAALKAAQESYAPYSGGYAGCALETADGLILSGRYVENAAFNPTISSLQAALTIKNMSVGTLESSQISRAVLVELPTQTSQRLSSANLLKAVVPSVNLEYYEAILS